MLIALLGTYLLVTKGRLDSLQLAPGAVFWGVGAGVSQALYTLIPIPLLKKVRCQDLDWLGHARWQFIIYA
ncbi:hypothetical protein [Secundilactobacillus silagei]|uniref:hypothetical protein n=1 Tax=Secundilactobacillus silagei TaxID=1293415 RepID=UPI0006D16CE2|nr:hypothetical protein [Secundilactobacillus silagei]